MMIRTFPTLPDHVLRQLHDLGVVEDQPGAERFLLDCRRALAHKPAAEWAAIASLLHSGVLNTATKVDPSRRQRLHSFLARIRWPN